MLLAQFLSRSLDKPLLLLPAAAQAVGAGLRSTGQSLAGTAKSAAAGALAEAKFLVKDVKEMALVKGVLSFFR